MVSSLLSVCDGANLSIWQHAYNLYHIRMLPYKFVICLYMIFHELYSYVYTKTSLLGHDTVFICKLLQITNHHSVMC